MHPSLTTDAVTLTRAGVVSGLWRLGPFALFVVPFGMAFGVAAVERGLSTAQTLLMSALVFAGAAQFAALELWAAPLPYLSLALVVFAVNARHLVMGAALAPWINRLPPAPRLAALGVMSDANFAASHAAFEAGGRDAGVLLGGGLALWLAWMVGTTVGLGAGASLGDLDRFGVDVVMVVFLAAVVTGGVRSHRSVPPLAVAGAVAVLTLELLPTGWNVIAGAVAGGLVGALRHEASTDAR